jgi:Na+-transporting NADH:ubiquinone oxidoreductase subunit NqrC
MNEDKPDYNGYVVFVLILALLCSVILGTICIIIYVGYIQYLTLKYYQYKESKISIKRGKNE